MVNNNNNREVRQILANAVRSGGATQSRVVERRNNTRLGGWRGPPPGVRANALARARELVASEANHRRTLNTRLANLQGRQTNLSRLPMGPPGRWNALGQDAESLYDYIRNHNLTNYAREQGVQSAIATIISDAIAYRYMHGIDINSGSNNNNARANRNAIARARANNNAARYAAGPPPPNDPYLVQQNNYAGGDGRNEAMNAMKNASNNFKLKTTWGRRANKNTASAWYNQTTKKIKKMNHSVINNIIGQNKFRPGPINGNTQLYFDANDPKRHLFTKNGMVGSRGLNPYYGKNTPMRPYLLPRAVNQELFRFMATRERNARTAARRPRSTRNANNFYNSNTNNVGGGKRKRKL